MSTRATSEITKSTDPDRLVQIVSLDGDDFDEVGELPVEQLTAHLSQWDYGDENDQAATVNGYVQVQAAERFDAHTINHGGLEYWLAVDQDLRMCTLLRRPLKNSRKV